MRIKVKSILNILLVSSLLLTGCSSNPSNNNETTTNQQENVDNTQEVINNSNENNDAIYDNEIADDEEQLLDDLNIIDKIKDTLTPDLSSKQKNSIAMLNYLAFISEELNQSKDNRLALEEVYTILLNNTEPDKIDETTQDHLNNLLNIITRYRMVSIKRDRLQYIYNQDKASSISEAIPDPLAVLSVVGSLDWKKLVMTIGYTAIDSYNNYKKTNTEIDKEFFISGWELDDEENETLEKNRNKAFNYMVDIVREYNLSKGISLNENAVEQFVEYCNETNVHRKIQFLESEEETYKLFGNYWLELADAYYETEQYTKCLSCIEKYQDLYTGIFRKDYDYAEVLPKVIVAAKETYADKEYVEELSNFADDLVLNTENSDWSSRYFAAQVYLDLYGKTADKDYLNKVYKISLNNVNQLIDNQIELNQTYLNDVVEIELPKVDDTYLTKEEKEELKDEQKQQQKELDKYNKSLKEVRKTELPSLYEPLILNCDLLFAVSNEIDISKTEKAKIEGILQTEEEGVFISKIINNRYSFGKTEEYDITVSKNNIIIPSELLCEGMNVSLLINDGEKVSVLDDLKLTKVKRENEDLSSFMAYFESKEYKKVKWEKGFEVIIELSYGTAYEPIELVYKVTKYDDKGWLPDEVVFTKYEK